MYSRTLNNRGSHNHGRRKGVLAEVSLVLAVVLLVLLVVSVVLGVFFEDSYWGLLGQEHSLKKKGAHFLKAFLKGN